MNGEFSNTRTMLEKVGVNGLINRFWVIRELRWYEDFSFISFTMNFWKIEDKS